jgi:hypothetical protein
MAGASLDLDILAALFIGSLEGVPISLEEVPVQLDLECLGGLFADRGRDVAQPRLLQQQAVQHPAFAVADGLLRGVVPGVVHHHLCEEPGMTRFWGLV